MSFDRKSTRLTSSHVSISYVVVPLLPPVPTRRASDLATRHLQAPSWLHPDDITALQLHLYPAIERRWLESIDPYHQAGIGHDIYLKLWALSEPNIATDYVL